MPSASDRPTALRLRGAAGQDHAEILRKNDEPTRSKTVRLRQELVEALEKDMGVSDQTAVIREALELLCAERSADYRRDTRNTGRRTPPAGRGRISVRFGTLEREGIDALGQEMGLRGRSEVIRAALELLCAERVAERAAGANREHAAWEQAYGTAIEHAFRAGEYLIAAKAEVTHGEWLPWLAEHFSGTERTAQAYMSIASKGNRQPAVHSAEEQELAEALDEDHAARTNAASKGVDALRESA